MSRSWLAASGIAITLAIPGCSADEGPGHVDVILAEQRAEIMAQPGVTGVGLGLCDHAPCIKVFAEARSPGLERSLDDLLGETPFTIVVTDRFKARPEDP